MVAAATSIAPCGLIGGCRLMAARQPIGCVVFVAPGWRRPSGGMAIQMGRRRKRDVAVCFVVGSPAGGGDAATAAAEGDDVEEETATVEVSVAEGENRAVNRAAKKQSERRAYLVAAMMSSLGITSMAVAAVYYRFSWQMEGGEVPVTEMLGTFSLSVGAAVGMEFWARWAHRALWHASLWHMHESHHRPREGPFELNDVFAIINAVPAIALLAFGFFNRGLFPGLCFGAGLGITLFGMAYMFVHDGLVHRRFPVGPIANVPYFRRVAAASSDPPHGQVRRGAIRAVYGTKGAGRGGRLG
uniref:beta-carotene 3-hydroxylase n=1 Tax=Lilium hybrid cultivar TaxID=156531 RepID=A0A8K1ZBM9_9LILI|nr:LhBCH2 [Lilium hybrid cultivar]